mmetsp:Transcript_78217/g.188834  ORF Transcript_78217/g.188834 Transcript_78217/m.188834 type:complete len:221 (+) Transcript_78217:345-1007(+)
MEQGAARRARRRGAGRPRRLLAPGRRRQRGADGRGAREPAEGRAADATRAGARRAALLDQAAARRRRAPQGDGGRAQGDAEEPRAQARLARREAARHKGARHDAGLPPHLLLRRRGLLPPELRLHLLQVGHARGGRVAPALRVDCRRAAPAARAAPAQQGAKQLPARRARHAASAAAHLVPRPLLAVEPLHPVTACAGTRERLDRRCVRDALLYFCIAYL